MSFPTIPDVTPEISVTRADALNLLLASIASEECSISRLMDAERDKILAVVCRCGDCGDPALLEINQSVDAVMQSLVNMQMLLKAKLALTLAASTDTDQPPCDPDSPCNPDPPPCDPDPPCNPDPSPCDPVPPPRPKPFCCVNGTASAPGVSVSVCADGRGGTLSFSTSDSCGPIFLRANCGLSVQCPCEDQAVVQGTGRLQRSAPGGTTVTGTVCFTLTIFFRNGAVRAIRMELTGRSYCLDTGTVCVTGSMTLRRCCV